MPNWHESIKADCEGPLGIPMKDAQAKEIDEILKSLPEEDRVLRKSVTAIPTSELVSDERCDVSWITTERPDHQKDIVLSKGCDDTIFKQNPIVTLNHQFNVPAVGVARWWKPAQDGDVRGIKAKTHYPKRPRDYSELEVWMPEKVWHLVQQRLLPGKSVGFLPKPGKTRYPTPDELKRNKDWEGCKVYEEWMLVEFAVCTKPVNPETLVLEIQKSGLELPDETLEFLEIDKSLLVPKLVVELGTEAPAPTPAEELPVIKAEQSVQTQLPTAPFVTADMYTRALLQSLLGFDYAAQGKKLFDNCMARYMGRV